MKLRNVRLLKLLTEKQVPVWLVIILVLIPLVGGQYFQRQQEHESIRSEVLDGLVAFEIDNDLFAQSICQFRMDLEAFSEALSRHASVELVTSLGEKAADSQEIMIEANQRLRNRHVVMASISGKCKRAGYDFGSALEEPLPLLTKIDIEGIVRLYKEASDLQQPEIVTELGAIVSSLIPGYDEIEETTHEITQTTRKWIATLSE